MPSRTLIRLALETEVLTSAAVAAICLRLFCMATLLGHLSFNQNDYISYSSLYMEGKIASCKCHIPITAYPSLIEAGNGG